MKKSFNNLKYYVGLDIGTDSIGWAVTDEDYELLKVNRKALWGVHLFSSGNTAADRRLHRSARRRLARRKQRNELVQELFSEAISKVDLGFFQRLKDSFFWEEDKTFRQPNTLFNDQTFQDRDYHRAFPTIYHLRKALIENKDPEGYDVRLVYLAIAHIIKNRGHFLFENQNFEMNNDFQSIFSEMEKTLAEEMDIQIKCSDSQELIDILKNEKINKTEKKKIVASLIGLDTPQGHEVATLMIGGTASLHKLFPELDLQEEEITKISFSGGFFDEKYDQISNLLEDKTICIEKIKTVHDWRILSDILADEKFLPFAKVKQWEVHRQDLRNLKSIIKKYLPEAYKEIFSDTSGTENYCAYIGKTEKEKCTQEQFCKFIEKELKKIKSEDPVFLEVQNKALNRTLLPKLKAKDNSVIPYQLNQRELQIILENASKYLPFLNEVDENGLSIKEKIEKILLFRIPYYIGPLNPAHSENGFSWVVRKNKGKVLPWTFDQLINEDASAENFIARMTNKCTYLPGKDVLPKDSLLYRRYMVLNELNNLKIDNTEITPEIKQRIFTNLFMRSPRVTQKKLRNYLLQEGIITKDSEISGIDGDFKSSLKSYLDFKRILREKAVPESVIEETIRAIVLFNGTKLLEDRLNAIGKGFYTAKEIKALGALNYRDWGRFSGEFLTEVYHVENTGECCNIMQKLYNTNKNLMQLLSSEYQFSQRIEEIKRQNTNPCPKTTYQTVADLYASPAVKRGIWRAMQIVDEIFHMMGHPPEKLFLEVAREEGEKKRTLSRKNQLAALYTACKKNTEFDMASLEEKLASKDDSSLRSDRLYLYFTQMGKCMYSREPIDLSQLNDKTLYDIDHIYPQSQVKDDSLDNRVLVKSILNREKSNSYPIAYEIQQKNSKFWQFLRDKNFISKKKYDRLTRKTEFSDEELNGFISRQLVETRQSTKAAATILQQVFPQTNIVYVKAGNVSTFRQDFDLIKVRELNDFHHAADAYLNIVVGNVYDTRFTKNPLNFIQGGGRGTYNLKRLFESDVIRNNKTAWIAGKDGTGTIQLVKKTLQKNNIQFTRYAYEQKGDFFDQQLKKKGEGQFPIKTKDRRYADIQKYGGYNKVSGAYFFVVEHTKNNKKTRSIEHVPVYLSKQIANSPERLLAYCREKLNLIDPKLIISRIKFDTLFKIDGFLMHLSSRSGDSLRFKNAVQLTLPEQFALYIKKIGKFCDRNKVDKNLTITFYDGITLEKNQELFEALIQKMENTIYAKVFSSVAAQLSEKQNLFTDLSIEDQCVLLNEIVHLFQCNILPANLSLINGGKSVGLIQKTKNITGYKEVIIINQSITGIFIQKVDLLKS